MAVLESRVLHRLGEQVGIEYRNGDAMRPGAIQRKRHEVDRILEPRVVPGRLAESFDPDLTMHIPLWLTRLIGWVVCEKGISRLVPIASSIVSTHWALRARACFHTRLHGFEPGD